MSARNSDVGDGAGCDFIRAAHAVKGFEVKNKSRPEAGTSVLRDWLRRDVKGTLLPGGSHLSAAYERFTTELPELCSAARLDEGMLTFTDFYELLKTWLRTNP